MALGNEEGEKFDFGAGDLVVFHNPKSIYNNRMDLKGKSVIGTHVELYLGSNCNGNLVFAGHHFRGP